MTSKTTVSRVSDTVSDTVRECVCASLRSRTRHAHWDTVGRSGELRHARGAPDPSPATRNEARP